MTTITAPTRKTISLPAGTVLTVTTGVGSAASVSRLADSTGGAPGSPTAVAESSAPTFGPFTSASWWAIDATAGTVTDTQATGYPSDVGFVNPMTTAGDTIVGGASGAPARLAKGADGTLQTMVGGAVAWAVPATVAYSSLSGKPTLGTISSLNQGADASIVIPGVATITVVKGIITAVV